MSILEVELENLAPPNVITFIIVPLFKYSFRVGSFLSTRTVYAGNNCSFSLGDPVVSYGAQSASALISITPMTCSTPASLSTGAIVGIAVGAAIGGIALATGVVLLTIHLTRLSTRRMQNEIKIRDVDNIAK